MVTTRPPKTIVKPTALGPVANTDTKLLIYGLFQKGRVLAQDGMGSVDGSFIASSAARGDGPGRYCQVDVERANLSRRADFLCSHRTAQVTSCQTMKARSRSSR